MKRLFLWLLKPAVLALIVVLLLSLVVWYEGPLLAFNGKEPLGSSGARWRVILLLVALWAVYFLWRSLSAYLASRRLMAGIQAPVAPAQPSAGQEEQTILSQRMREAMAALRKAAPEHRWWGGQYLYRLPWYMFVGAPGSGKTTTLLHSGLRFPLADTLGPQAIGGIGGTRNCDWWFTNEAVLLDTAGRYTTQDSDSGLDRAGWHGFLALLKKHRPRRPVNGIIVAFSVADLLQQGPAARLAQAQAIRARIKELHEHIATSFPIYVTVTKCDLLAGFVEFFEGMGKEERAQVWGMTFPLAADGAATAPLARFQSGFLALEKQLQARVLDRMQQERDMQRRALIYRFPQQFAAIGDSLGEFLEAAFDPSRFEQAAQLRGVYFTSGTQSGSPIDRVMGALASAFGLQRNALPSHTPSGRSYFVTALLRELIFKEAGLAGLDRGLEKRRRFIRLATAAACGVLLVLLGAGLATSYVRNRAYVQEMAAHSAELQKLAQATPAQGSVLEILPLLNAARALPGGYAERDLGVPLLNRFGISQADKLGAGAERAYSRVLRATLMPRVVERLEELLRRADVSNQEYLYGTLRVYLMLAQRSHLDPESVQAWVERDWARSVPDANAEQRAQLLAHLDALLSSAADSTEPVVLDGALVAQTRTTLAMMPLPQRLYNRLKRQVERAKLPEFSVNRAVGRDASALLARKSGAPLSRGISGVYSLAGYRELLKETPQAMLSIAEDSWVLDRREAEATLDKTGTEALRTAVLELYFADYIRHWDELLNDVKIPPLPNLDQGARITNALAAQDSPLRLLLQAAAKETTLEAVNPKSGTAAIDAAVRDKLGAARAQLETLLGGEEAPVSAAKAGNPVDRHFDSLHKLVSAPSAGAPAPIDAVLAMLKDASQYMDAAEAARRGGSPAPAGEVLQRLKREGEGKPAPLGAILQNIDSAGAGLAQGSERLRLQALWNAVGASFCRDAIAGRYPMQRGAGKDVTPDDFGKFFGPGGIMDAFFAQNLAQRVDMAGGQWTWRDTGGPPLGIPQGVLAQFQRAARLREMFFAAGGRQPGLRFDLTALSADPALSRVLLEVDGQAVLFTPASAARPVAISLPGARGGLMRFDTTPALRAELRSDGPWAWFRLIDKGTLESGSQPERFKLSFDLEGRKVSYALHASSVINPFRRDALEQFRCPAAW